MTSWRGTTSPMHSSQMLLVTLHKLRSRRVHAQLTIGQTTGAVCMHNCLDQPSLSVHVTGMQLRSMQAAFSDAAAGAAMPSYPHDEHLLLPRSCMPGQCPNIHVSLLRMPLFRPCRNMVMQSHTAIEAWLHGRSCCPQLPTTTTYGGRRTEWLLVAKAQGEHAHDTLSSSSFFF